MKVPGIVDRSISNLFQESKELEVHSMMQDIDCPTPRSAQLQRAFKYMPTQKEVQEDLYQQNRQKKKSSVFSDDNLFNKNNYKYEQARGDFIRQSDSIHGISTRVKKKIFVHLNEAKRIFNAEQSESVKNVGAKHAINYLIAAEVIADTAKDKAKFVFYTLGLNASLVGEYIGMYNILFFSLSTANVAKKKKLINNNN